MCVYHANTHSDRHYKCLLKYITVPDCMHRGSHIDTAKILDG